jgi:predicted protein tyrosine phosphatase
LVSNVDGMIGPVEPLERPNVGWLVIARLRLVLFKADTVFNDFRDCRTADLTLPLQLETPTSRDEITWRPSDERVVGIGVH